MDITWLIEIAIAFIGCIGLILMNKFVGVDKVQRIMAIVETVVAAANELEITGSLTGLGKTKAEYALERTKTLLAKNNIIFDEDELIVFIKSAVTKLRIEVAGTDAEKVVKGSDKE